MNRSALSFYSLWNELWNNYKTFVSETLKRVGFLRCFYGNISKTFNEIWESIKLVENAQWMLVQDVENYITVHVVPHFRHRSWKMQTYPRCYSYISRKEVSSIKVYSVKFIPIKDIASYMKQIIKKLIKIHLLQNFKFLIFN